MIDEAVLQFDHLWRTGDRDEARRVARDYIDSRREELAPIFADYSLEALVAEVEALRRVGRLADRIIVDMWLLSEFEPQQITGVAAVTLPLMSSYAELAARTGGR